MEADTLTHPTQPTQPFENDSMRAGRPPMLSDLNFLASLQTVLESMLYNETVAVKLAQPFYRGMIAMYSLVSALAIVGNLLMLYAIISAWSQRKSQSHRCFYLNLIVCDLLVALTILPATCADQIDNRWFLGEVACKLRHSLSVSLMCSSVFTLTCLSWLRSLSVSKNVVGWLDGGRRLARNELLTIGSIWLASLAISAPVARVSVVDRSAESRFIRLGVNINWPVCREDWSLIGRQTPESGNSTSAAPVRGSEFWYGVAVLNLVCLLPLLSLTIAYFRICRAIYVSNRILNVYKRYEAMMMSCSYQTSDTTLVRLSSMRHHFSLASTCSAMNRRKRVATSRRMFLLGVALVLIFALTWLPMQCLQLYRSSLLDSDHNSNSELMHKLVSSFHLLALTNCLFNPYFLVATHSLYRRTIRRLGKRCRCCCGCRITWNFGHGTDRIELQQL